MIGPSPLAEIVAAQKRGEDKGITSICSANPLVIEAVLHHARQTREPVLIESTCNQVNQFGGYTGWTPAQFVVYLKEIAGQQNFPFDQILIGGDHLGPSPWQDEPADQAMEKARILVHECVRAGYHKIHLDASMRCADDDREKPLDIELAAERSAELAEVAETTFQRYSAGPSPPCYVIGTEVPLPGGAIEQEEKVTVTKTADVADTITVTRKAFQKRGLADAWQRVMAVVVQPGVEYGDDTLFEYDPQRAAELSRFIKQYDHLVYEAHSTDYQAAASLKKLVEDHFAILKVGPALTFAFREGVFALAAIEEELLAKRQGAEMSRVRETLEGAMLANPVYWQKYYQGNVISQRLARKYSFSDRSRYYWPVKEVQAALSRLVQNLEEGPLPLTLLSQYLPLQYGRIRAGHLANAPRPILVDKVWEVLAGYSYACGYLPTGG